MKKMVIKYYREYEHFIKYCLIGACGVSLDFIIYTLLVSYTSTNYQLANFISISTGIINNFILNVHFNFKTKDRILRRFLSFYLIGFLGIVITAIMLYILVDKMSLGKIVSKAITLIVILIVQYFLNKNLSFRK